MLVIFFYLMAGNLDQIFGAFFDFYLFNAQFFLNLNNLAFKLFISLL